MKKISHITINTGNNMVYEDDSVIMDNIRSVIQEMVQNAKETGITDVLDGAVAKVAVDEELGVYMATLYADSSMNIPVLETAGTSTEAGALWLWESMSKLYNVVYGKREKAIKCPKAPFICDLVYPTGILAFHLTYWTGDFAKCFGIEMLKTFDKK